MYLVAVLIYVFCQKQKHVFNITTAANRCKYSSSNEQLPWQKSPPTVFPFVQSLNKSLQKKKTKKKKNALFLCPSRLRRFVSKKKQKKKFLSLNLFVWNKSKVIPLCLRKWAHAQTLTGALFRDLRDGFASRRSAFRVGLFCVTPISHDLSEGEHIYLRYTYILLLLVHVTRS